MDKINYRLVFNRKKKLNNQGKALVQVELYQNGRKVYISTRIYLYPYQWDNKKRRIIDHPQMEELNRLLDELVLKLQWRELEMWKKGADVSLDCFKHEISSGKESPDGFITFGRKWVENSSRKESTKRNLMSTILLMEEFNPSLKFGDIDYVLLTRFENFMKCRKDLSVNTIAKHMRQLRTMVNEAIRQNYMETGNYPFRKYRIKTTESRHSFLLPDELKKLEVLQLQESRKELAHTLDAFLFCCYTGLRYSDFTQLSSKNVMRLGGKLWLKYRTVKTGVDVSVPLYLLFHGKAVSILHRYKDRPDDFFHIRSNSSVNKDLKILGETARLKKHISFHTARHTNATLLIYMGVQITTVQKLLGHRNVKTTQVYSEVFSGTIVKDLKKCRF